MRYLLDTCVISELTRKRPLKSVVSWVQAQDEISLFLSVLTFGEIEKGIAKLDDTAKARTLRTWMERDLKRRFGGRILDVDHEVACKWGEASGNAEKKGIPLPVIDGLLAATALVHGLTFVTRNTSDAQPSGVPVLDPWN